MSNSQKWWELLGNFIKDPHERQRIANELKVSPITLTRWASGESTPRAQNLRHLLHAIPEFRKTFQEQEPEEFKKIFGETIEVDETVQNIPSVFYTRVLNAHCNLPNILHFSSLCDVILLQALTQLDPSRVGMEITVVQCMYPSPDNKIRSLREGIGRGTPPWKRELEQRTVFLGAESLAGYTVTMGRALALHSRQEGEHLFPARWTEWEESAMAHPIMRSDSIAGCLLISSTQPNFFLSLALQKLIQQYAELLSLAFDPEAFYPLHHVDLRRILPYEAQHPYLSTFRQRVANLMLQTSKQKRPINVLEAERLVWQQIEEDILQEHIF